MEIDIEGGFDSRGYAENLKVRKNRKKAFLNALKKTLKADLIPGAVKDPELDRTIDRFLRKSNISDEYITFFHNDELEISKIAIQIEEEHFSRMTIQPLT